MAGFIFRKAATLLRLHFSIPFNMDMFVGLKDIDMVVRVFDSKTLDQGVLMSNDTALVSSELLSLLQFRRRCSWLQSDVEDHLR